MNYDERDWEYTEGDEEKNDARAKIALRLALVFSMICGAVLIYAFISGVRYVL